MEKKVKKLTKLTEEEVEIVEENHRLIYGFLRHRFFGNPIVDDNEWHKFESEWYGLVAESFIKAVKTHDKSKGALSTLFYRIAKNDMFNERRRKTESLGVQTSIHEDARLYTEDFHQFEILEGLSKNQLHIVGLLYDKYTQAEIAEIMKLSPSKVSREVSKIRKIVASNCKHSG